MKNAIVIVLVFIILGGVVALVNRDKESKGTQNAAENGGIDSSESTVNNYIDRLASGLKQAKDLNQQSYTLDLSGQGLTAFPFDILDQTNIKILNLSNNKLTSLPAEIRLLTNLEELRLENNLLTGSLVAEIRHFQKLRILDASGNKLSGIPAEIGQLGRLEIIDFSNNQLDSMPQEIVNIAGNLKEFNLSGNKYSSKQQEKIKQQLPNTEVIFN